MSQIQHFRDLISRIIKYPALRFMQVKVRQWNFISRMASWPRKLYPSKICKHTVVSLKNLLIRNRGMEFFMYTLIEGCTFWYTHSIFPAMISTVPSITRASAYKHFYQEICGHLCEGAFNTCTHGGIPNSSCTSCITVTLTL